MATRTHAARRNAPATFGAGLVLALAALFWVSPSTANHLTDSALRISVAVANEASRAFMDHVTSSLPSANADTPHGAGQPTTGP